MEEERSLNQLELFMRKTVRPTEITNHRLNVPTLKQLGTPLFLNSSP
ncbi:hypothetical protein CCACVL1_01889 [Corchorus capsularis]|uniref:Uncharacterized protein n=1 Tax=Corchorus capsularis TaxID=210143 RepID=A0A1R3KEL4_COCAP|nr:hypothetical protein CCACVL1_01889 [Corchorus capsularis]